MSPLDAGWLRRGQRRAAPPRRVRQRPGRRADPRHPPRRRQHLARPHRPRTHLPHHGAVTSGSSSTPWTSGSCTPWRSGETSTLSTLRNKATPTSSRASSRIKYSI